MEAKELKLIEEQRKSNYELDRLYKEHLGMGEQIEKLENMKGLSSAEEQELKNLKIRKLEGKEKISEIIGSIK